QRWPAAVAALPRVALAAMLAGLVLQPAVNALSRRFELQADRDALSLTGDPASYRSAYLKLAETNLADPNPHRLVEWYFYDHPALSRRLALAEQAPLQAHTQ
ncbi:MAG: M48 family metalloprotease, partial [Phycisphaerae bacterium]